MDKQNDSRSVYYQMKAIERILAKEQPQKLKESQKEMWKAIEAYLKTHSAQEHQINKFGVLKANSWQGHKKGDYLLGNTYQRAIKEGVKVRPIRCHNKELRRVQRKLLPLFDLPCRWQHGFTIGQGIENAVNPYLDAISGSLILVDLENAFNQISRFQIQRMLEVIFKVNRESAKAFSKLMCDQNGYLFQGNPLAPAIFNILSCQIGWELLKMNTDGKRKIVEVSQYADDITVMYIENYIPYTELRRVCTLIDFLGWKSNPKKCKRKKLSETGRILGIYRTGNYLICSNQRAFHKQLRLWKHLTQKGVTETRRLAKDGKQIRIESMQQGIKAWLTYCKRITSNPRLISLTTTSCIGLDF